MKNKTKNTALAGLLYAIIIVMQLLKNISPFISGPVINAVMVTVAIYIGLWWGIGFCVLVPVTSVAVAFASPMTAVTLATNGITLPVIMIGNVILVLGAYFGFRRGGKMLITALLLGAVLKWLFMWGCADLIIKPLFSEKLGTSVAVINKIFSTLQLYSGLLSAVLIIPVTRILKKVSKR